MSRIECPKCNHVITLCRDCHKSFQDFEYSDDICLECEPLEDD